MRFDRCPYCDCKITVDLAEAWTWQPPLGHEDEVIINDHPDQPVLRFPAQAKKEPAAPCIHLVYLLADVQSGITSAAGQAVTLTWLHPWLLGGPQRFSRFYDLWEAIFEPDDRDDTFSVPYEIHRPVTARKLAPGGDCWVSCQGWVIYTHNPQSLFEELQRRGMVVG